MEERQTSRWGSANMGRVRPVPRAERRLGEGTVPARAACERRVLERRGGDGESHRERLELGSREREREEELERERMRERDSVCVCVCVYVRKRMTSKRKSQEQTCALCCVRYV